MNLKTLNVLVIIMLIWSCGTLVFGAEDLQYSREEGVIDGAAYLVVKPTKWNRSVFFIAKSFRPADVPLRAEFNPENPFHNKLLKDGWMIATSSYRRNGVILKDGADDLIALRKLLGKKYGQFVRVIVLGSSMGGTISTILAETGENLFSGAVAIGAALQLMEQEKNYLLTNKPTIPILFLSNRNETAFPSRYVEEARKKSAPATFWYVDREGHSKFSFFEEEAAFRAILSVVNDPKRILENNKNITIHSSPKNSTAEFKDDRVYAKVTSVHPFHGNLYTAFIQSDLEKVGIKPDSDFIVGFGEKSFHVYFGVAYSDVPQNEWVAFMTAEGYLKIARNYANAAKTLECKPGDKIFIRPLPKK